MSRKLRVLFVALTLLALAACPVVSTGLPETWSLFG